MKLIEYVQQQREKGRKDGWIAVHLGISRPYLIDLLNERRLPSLPVAQKIAKRTGRKVPLTSWPDKSSSPDGGKSGA